MSEQVLLTSNQRHRIRQISYKSTHLIYSTEEVNSNVKGSYLTVYPDGYYMFHPLLTIGHSPFNDSVLMGFVHDYQNKRRPFP
jgi:hypothetical protein